MVKGLLDYLLYSTADLHTTWEEYLGLYISSIFFLQTCPGSHGKEQTQWTVANLQLSEGTVSLFEFTVSFVVYRYIDSILFYIGLKI